MATVRTRSGGRKGRERPTAAAAPRAARPGRGRQAALTALVVVAIVSAAAWSYSTSFAGVFVFDDEFAIVRNPHIRQLWPLTRSMSAPPESPVSVRPIASLTLAINYALAPLDARDTMTLGVGTPAPDVVDRYLRNVWGYHFVNLALHVLAALALFGVVRRTLRSERLRTRFGAVSTWLGLAVALVWVVHPLLADAVTYITQRTEVLMGLFYLLTLYCAIRASESGVPRDRRLWSGAAVVACALGMGSKQTMVTVPFVVLAWDWLFAADSTGPRFRRLRWRLYAGLAATSVILVVGLALERWPHSIGINREGWTPWTYLLTQAGVITHYLRLVFVPSPLVLDYDGWPMARSVVDVAPYAAFVASLVVATGVLLWRRQPWGFLGAWLFALLAPSSSVLPLATEIAAERRMYTASASVVALVVIAGYVLASWTRDRFFPNAPASRTVMRAAGLVVVGSLVAAFSVMTAARNRDYWSEERIWRDAVEKRPFSSRAHLNLGVQLSIERQNQEAELHLREAVRLKGTDSAAHGNLGSFLCSQGRLDEGIAHMERALALDSDFELAYRNLAEAYASQGRRALAAKYFAIAVEKLPDDVFLLNRLGWLLATSPEDGVRDGARAVRVAEHAVRLTSRQDLQSLHTLAAAYAEADRFAEAAAVGREAMTIVLNRGDREAAARIAASVSAFEAHQKVRESF